MTIPAGKHRQVDYAIDTSLVVFFGSSMLLWIEPPAAGGSDDPLCLIVTVDIVAPSGEVLPPEAFKVDPSIAEKIAAKPDAD
jgi:hypothetical protein